MSRRTFRCVFLAIAAALACANVGLAPAARAQTGRNLSVGATHREAPVLEVDTAVGHTYVGVIETRSDRSTAGSPQTLGALSSSAAALRPNAQSVVPAAPGHELGRVGGPALGSRAPPLHTA